MGNKTNVHAAKEMGLILFWWLNRIEVSVRSVKPGQFVGVVSKNLFSNYESVSGLILSEIVSVIVLRILVRDTQGVDFSLLPIPSVSQPAVFFHHAAVSNLM